MINISSDHDDSGDNVFHLTKDPKTHDMDSWTAAIQLVAWSSCQSNDGNWNISWQLKHTMAKLIHAIRRSEPDGPSHDTEEFFLINPTVPIHVNLSRVDHQHQLLLSQLQLKLVASALKLA
jgi:hypothetical protein